MNAKTTIDILAVMDSLSRALSANAKPLLGTSEGTAAVAAYAEFNQACAAVSELIEATREYRRLESAGVVDHRRSAACRRIDAALARVGGAK